MARAGSNFEGIYASPQSSRSGSFSELGLTLLPSTGYRPDSRQAENHGYGAVGLQLRQSEGPQPCEGVSEGIKYPSPTPTLGSFQPAISDDGRKHPVILSNSDERKQVVSTSTNNSTVPLFVPLRPLDRYGRPTTSSVTPTYITTPLQYRPSAPHLHTLVSTGTTLAASAQIDHLKERNRQLTMERDRYYHLSKPAILRTDDLKSEQIRQLQSELKDARERNDGLQWALCNQNQANSERIQRLQAELRDATEQNGRVQWALRQETARANHAQAQAVQPAEESRRLMVPYDTLNLHNASAPPTLQNLPLMSPIPPCHAEDGLQCRESSYIDLTSPKKSRASQQGGARQRKAPSVIAMPSLVGSAHVPASVRELRIPITQMPPSTAAAEPSSKRPGTGSNSEKQPPGDPPFKRQRTCSGTTENQPRKQQSTFDRSHFNNIQARVRSALKGKTLSYAWLKDKESDKVTCSHGRMVSNGTEAGKAVHMVSGVDASNGAQLVNEVDATNQAGTAADDEPSELEIAEFDKALLDAWDEVGDEGLEGDGDGDSHSLFGDLVIADS